jgi:aminoglycoside phosphotransferase (APT) family kinase protein
MMNTVAGRGCLFDVFGSGRLLVMSTLERDASIAWSTLHDVWPDLTWANAAYGHGAFLHVAVLGSTSVVRVSFAADHEARVIRQSGVLRQLSDAGLRTRVPKLLRTHTGDIWSAMACTFVEGSHDVGRPWDEVRHHFAGVLYELRSAQLPPESLPPPRAWCGGTSWPDLVERILVDSSPAVQSAARTVVRKVLSLDGHVNPSLVHGDFGPHNVLWDTSGTPALIDFDNACAADPAIDVAPLIGFYGAANVREIVDADMLARAKTYRASLPLQVAAAAALGADHKLQNHALLNFTRRLEAGSLHDPAAIT